MCVTHIDMQNVLNLVELLDRDELGVRIFEMALQICTRHYLDDDLSFEFMRMNTGGSQVLESNQYVKHKYFARIYPWQKLAFQKPDGLYSIKMKHKKIRREYVVQYESDGMEKTNDPMGLVHKIMQGIDLQATFHTKDKYDPRTTYAVRGNICNMLIEKERANANIYWLHNFVRSHIKTVLIMMQHMAFPKNKETKLHHKEPDLKMHYCFFVGAFDIIHNKNELPFNTKSIENYLSVPDLPTLESENQVLQFQKATKSQKKQYCGENFVYDGFGTNLPFPLMPLQDDDGSGNLAAIQLETNVLNDWSIKSKLYMFLSDDYEVQCLGFQIGRIILPDGDGGFQDESIKIRGLITVSTVLDFMKELFIGIYSDVDRQSIIDASFEGNWFDEDKGKEIEEEMQRFFSHSGDLDKKITLKDFYGIVAFINSMIFYTQFLLFYSFGAKINRSGNLNLKGISWQVQNYDKTRFERVKIEDSEHGLNQLKMRIRNDPHFQKTRGNDLYLEEGYEKGGSLKSRILVSLGKGLPVLSKDVENYLNQYKIPHAHLFCRILRVPSLLALREMARQAGNYGEIDDQYQSIIKLLPVGTQSEINFMFEKLRNELDFYVNGDDVKVMKNEITDLDFVKQILEILGEEINIRNTKKILNVLESPLRRSLSDRERQEIWELMKSL